VLLKCVAEKKLAVSELSDVGYCLTKFVCQEDQTAIVKAIAHTRSRYWQLVQVVRERRREIISSFETNTKDVSILTALKLDVLIHGYRYDRYKIIHRRQMRSKIMNKFDHSRSIRKTFPVEGCLAVEFERPTMEVYDALATGHSLYRYFDVRYYIRSRYMYLLVSCRFLVKVFVFSILMVKCGVF
jgi:hypothetical protein